MKNEKKCKIFSIYLTLAILISSSAPILYAPRVSAQMSGGGILPTPHYYGPYPNYATSQLPTVTVNPDNSTTVTGGIRKFIDSLPLLGPEGANNLDEYISVGIPDNVTYPGSDYYEIAVVEYMQKMHTDLPETKFRGYVQLETPANYNASLHYPLTYLNGSPILIDGQQVYAVDRPRYLGPFIIAQKDVPVRIKFYNLLPTGDEGNLFIPVDTTVMGAGEGSIMGEFYTQNRATIHLHGGRTPWISDGTPHQWVVPAGETTAYPRGVGVYNVPDMPDPGPGALTFYYTNEQSSRLMFYHDHSYGITRLNVYVGETAGYILRDDVENALIAAGIIPADEVPLVIQDKTFVPDNTTPITNMWGTFDSQLAFQDPTWNTTLYGGPGQLWYPHVYMPIQHPSDPSGVNPFGRWHYAPWFWPPGTVEYGPVMNPYYDMMNPDNPFEPELIPGTPNPSMPGEAFMDTPVLNGIAYPYLEVEPKAYRFRILNAANDRYFNFQLYLADDTVITPDGRNNTEVKMVPAALTPGFPDGWPTDGREGGVPDPSTAGPPFIVIGNEGGFLPKPVVLQMQPVDWNWDMGTFDFGNLAKYTLLLGPAERADVIIDFSNYSGKTLILYNDCPAPVPAGDPRLDYYTGNPDQTETGGAPSTLPGYGPNTRTLMQIRVKDTPPAAPFDVNALFAAFASNETYVGAYAASQNPPIVPQAAYSSAYNTNFSNTYARIYDNALTFTPFGSNMSITIPFKAKAIQDEMGESYETMYGRMGVLLGLELPRTNALMQTTLLYNYADPPTEIIAPSISGTMIGTLEDGTQIWKITHNGVDTHTLHWHMFEVQIINRVAWDNNIREPDPYELGWKETLRVNPLQDTIVALRPVIPNVPFDIPNSVRPIDVTMPLGAVLKTTNIFDVSGEPITLTNHLVNYGWEYIMHCHMLEHEEMDMMRPIVLAVPPRSPTSLNAFQNGSTVALTWSDNSLSETGFLIQRAEDPTFSTGLTSFTVGENVTAFVDNTVENEKTYYYRVRAENLVGDTAVYGAPAVGFPTMVASSNFTNVASVTTSISAVVVRGGNDKVFYRLYAPDTDTWEGWAMLPGDSSAGLTVDAPASAIVGNTLHLVIRDVNYLLYYGKVDLSTKEFSGWVPISGQTDSAPTLTSNWTHLILVVRGLNNFIYYRFLDLATDTWTDWILFESGSTMYSPAATTLSNTLHVIVKGSDGQSIWHSYLDLSSMAFSGWQQVGGSTPSDPTLTSSQQRGEVYLLVRGGDDFIYLNVWNSSWGGWFILPGGSTNDAVGSTVIGPQTLMNVVRGSDGMSLWSSTYDVVTSAFNGWTNLGGYTPSKPTFAG